MSATALLNALQARDVRLAARAGSLTIDAPRGVLTPALRAGLAAHKAELLGLLCVPALPDATRDALAIRFTGAESETCQPAIDFYIRAKRWPEAFFVASLIAPETAQRKAVAGIQAAQSGAGRCPLYGNYAARQETWRYERMTHDPDTGAALPEAIAGVAREFACAACGEVLDTTWFFDEDLLNEVEERAAIMEYDGGLSRQDAEQYAVWEVCAAVGRQSTVE